MEKISAATGLEAKCSGYECWLKPHTSTKKTFASLEDREDDLKLAKMESFTGTSWYEIEGSGVDAKLTQYLSFDFTTTVSLFRDATVNVFIFSPNEDDPEDARGIRVDRVGFWRNLSDVYGFIHDVGVNRSADSVPTGDDLYFELTHGGVPKGYTATFAEHNVTDDNSLTHVGGVQSGYRLSTDKSSYNGKKIKITLARQVGPTAAEAAQVAMKGQSFTASAAVTWYGEDWST